MILSVCPNPCVDCTIELDTLKLGGLNRIENKIITYSGKALNVAIGVARLGGDSFATGFMFNDNGKMFVHTLDDENVKTPLYGTTVRRGQTIKSWINAP